MVFKEFKDVYQISEVKEFPNRVPKNPKVSILIQTFQHEKYISPCLDNILNQKTSFSYEVLLGEDGSMDATREICIDFASKYPDKIKLFLHSPANKINVLGIPTGNFNAFYNFYHARGEYIAFCEGDDFWTDPFKLQKQVDFLQNNADYVMTYHRFEEIYEVSTRDQKETPLEQPAKDLGGSELSSLAYHPLLSTVCFRNCFRNLPEEMIEVINVDSFLLSMLGNCGKAKFQPEITASVYRRHSGGIWSKKNKERNFLIKILTYQKLLAWYLKNDRNELSLYFRKEIRRTRKMLLAFYLKKGMVFKAGKLLPGFFHSL